MNVTITSKDVESYPNDSYPEITKIFWRGGELIENFFEKFPNLKKLNLGKNQSSDLRTLSGLLQLETLFLFENQISDLSPLSGLLQLKELYLYHNQISDMSPITTLLQLKKLNLTGNQISDLSPLTGLLQLKELNLYHNQISDLRPLAELLQLETLYLYENQISDLSPLTGLLQLEKLHLDRNRISDLNPLVYLRNLTTLTYRENPLDIQTVQTTRFLQRLEIGSSSRQSIYNDGQNVHNTHIQKSICKSLVNLLKDPQPEFSLQKIVDNKLLPDKTKSLLVEYCEEKSIHSVHLITFEELLGYVWSRIENSSSSEDLFKILSEQIEDAECKCFTGRFNRVLSVLVGFYDDIVINISDNDRIGGIISIIGENIIPYNSEEHRNRSRERLLEEGYPEEMIEEWLSYIED